MWEEKMKRAVFFLVLRAITFLPRLGESVRDRSAGISAALSATSIGKDHDRGDFCHELNNVLWFIVD